MSDLRKQVRDAIAEHSDYDDGWDAQAEAVLRVFADTSDPRGFVIEHLTRDLDRALYLCERARATAQRFEEELALIRRAAAARRHG